MVFSDPVKIPVAGQKMVGTLYRPKDSEGEKLPAVVIFHGRGSSQARYTDKAEAVVAAGFITLIFSFRGCGESDGKFTEQTISMGMEDALAGYDFLAAQPGVDTTRIGVWGGSFGGYLASLVVAERPAKSLILAAPALYKNEWWDLVPETQEKAWMAYRNSKNFLENNAIKAISKYSGAFMLIEREGDDVCPPSMTQTFYEQATLASPKERALIVGVGGHRLVEKPHRQRSNELTAQFFTETLS